jgi:hypothetical protein
MAESGPINSDELAREPTRMSARSESGSTGRSPGGYVQFDTNTKQYLLPPEHALYWPIRIVPHFFRRLST